MSNIFRHRKIFLDRRRELRRHQTEAEERLWQYLRLKRLLGHKFTRQYNKGPYILDFFCFGASLGIELDGSQHFTQAGQEYDFERADFFSALGIKIVRFKNEDIFQDIDGVLEKIKAVLP